MTVPFSKITGKCYIAYADALTEPVAEWSTKGPYRFYFSEAYDKNKCEFIDVPSHAAKIGQASKGK